MSVAELLLMIDVQNDFCPGGTLAVSDGDAVVPAINRMLPHFEHVAATQDWHPAGHVSFAASHPGRAPFDTMRLPYGDQVLWPTHCVQGTDGAAFHAGLDLSRCEMILRKGFRGQIDSYSAFFENDRATPTGLAGWLRERGIQRVVLVGLATDYCVAWSAIDAVRQGFAATVVLDACRAIDVAGSLDRAQRDMAAAGVRMVRTWPG